MKNVLSCALTLGLLAAGYGVSARQAGTIAFVGVGVIPMDRETVLPNHVVIVRNGRIAEMGPAGKMQVPEDATRIDGAGKFLMPAIAEMHAHIPGGKATDAAIERTLLLYAANGIGTIRGMLGDPRHLEYRARVEKGELFSPRIYTSGPSFNGQSVPTVESAVEAVVAQKAAGYDLLKIHPGVKRDVFDALAAKAHELGIPFAGHVPLDVGLHRALEARYRSIDHLDGYIEALAKTPAESQFFGINLVNQVDESRIPSLVKETKAAGTWQVPTQTLFENMVGDVAPETQAQWPEMKYVPAEQVQKWVAQKQGMLEKIPAPDRAKFLQLRRRLVKALHDGGVPFALGSDAPQVWNVPGFSAHRELKALVGAGLTPFEALVTGTVAVGKYFNAGDIGTIAPGRRASVILLDANPLQDISNSSRIAGVMLDGRWMSKADLEKRLQN